ncbi:oligosaccharide repeat unit polymerase [Pectinatus sottacetonis]|uniref:oligosaccharide repeat unit polymerase n=1 Tax=Pectinatus sottacetonis TaxID=1002795 RepID=UPI0018C6423E|nr:oligosaccharide repeat unit polymerase [Pectinatus sottacetonis]
MKNGISFSTIILWMIVIFVSTFILWPDIVKGIVCFCVVLGAVLFFLFSCKNISCLEVKIYAFFMIYYIYIILNGIIFYDTIEKFVYGIYQYIFYSCVMFAALYVLPRVNLKKVLYYITIIGVLTSIVALYEFCTGKYIFVAFNDLVNMNHGNGSFVDGETVYRAVSLSVSPLSLGVDCGIYGITNYYLWFLKHEKKYIIFFFINIMGLYASYSRGPWVAFIIAFSFYTILNKLGDRITFRKILKILRSFVLILLIIATCIYFFRDNYYIGLFINRIFSIIIWNDSTTTISPNMLRFYYWLNAISIFTKNYINFLFGIGIGSTGGSAFAITVTESGILKRLVEGGIILFIIHYYIIYLIMKAGIKYKGVNRPKVIYALSVMMLILTDDVTEQITESVDISMIFWFICAVILFFIRKYKK